MSLYDDLRDQFRLILQNACSPDYENTLIINSHQAGNEPVGTYGVCNILDLRKVGLSSSSTLASESEDESYQLQVSIPYQALVQYSFVGSEAGALALYSSMRLGSSPLNREFSQAYNLGIMEVSNPRRLPQKRDTQWVEQQTFDVLYSMILSYSQAIDIVRRVDYIDSFTDELVSVPPQ